MMDTARLRIMVVLALVSLTLVSATSLTAQEVLTNDSILAMKKAGMSDSLILAKIRTSQTKFDTSTKGLIGLKSAGLSDQIIEAMVGHAGSAGSPPAAAAPAAPVAAAARATTAKETIFHLTGNKYVELAAASSSVEFNTSVFDSKTELVLKGKKAPYRISDRKPVFYSTWSANDVPLVRLKPGSDHDDRNLKISSGSYAPFGGSTKFGVRSEDKVDVESEKDARGLYKMTPKEPLKPGEYGFVLTYGMAGGTSGRVFDFGVD